jgi:hypothetical protein
MIQTICSTCIRTSSVTHAFLSGVSDSPKDKHSIAFEVVSITVAVALGFPCICTSPLTHFSLPSLRASLI